MLLNVTYRTFYFVFALQFKDCLGHALVDSQHEVRLPEVSSLFHHILAVLNIVPNGIGLLGYIYASAYSIVSHSRYLNTVCPSTLQTGLVDLSTVDVILLSNPLNMLALPFITEVSAY